MTTVTTVPVVPETGGHVARRLQRALGEERRMAVLTGLPGGDAEPVETLVRPAVRRLRPAAGDETVRVRPGGRESSRRHPVSGRPRPVACDRSYETDLHGSRLTRRGKVVVAAVWLVFAMAIAVMVNRPAEVPMPAETATVTVESGDTLWALAGDVAPGTDPRVTVEQIMELNGLRSAGDIHPGDLLVVPIVAD